VQDVPCPQGEFIKKGRQLRLQHVGTKKWLHSHLHRSPLSGQQEVSAYGSSQQSDSGDNWLVTWDGNNAHWDTNMKVQMARVAQHLCVLLCAFCVHGNGSGSIPELIRSPAAACVKCCEYASRIAKQPSATSTTHTSACGSVHRHHAVRSNGHSEVPDYRFPSSTWTPDGG
jgi:MIR domain